MDWNHPVSGSGVRGAAVGWAGNSNSQGVMRNSKGSTGGLMGSSRVSAAGAAVAASGGLLGPGVGVGASAGVRSTGARASGTPPQAGGDSLAHLRMLETMASNASIAPDEVGAYVLQHGPNMAKACLPNAWVRHSYGSS